MITTFAPSSVEIAYQSHPLVEELLNTSLIVAEDWDLLPATAQEEILTCDVTGTILRLLVNHRLLTEYQAGRVAAGAMHGLVLGNYRILERIGAGGMGVVYLGEHLRMRRRVAIKVLPLAEDQEPRLHRRFLSEIRAVAQLQHPNIVSALDDGQLNGSDPGEPSMYYFVMEYVPGHDLERLVLAQGPLAPTAACGVAYQVASALREAHKHDLVHRDIKPSNIQVTPDGQAKLLDFGLVRYNPHRMTAPGTILGTMDYIAPEQAQDAAGVDLRADLYGLGGTLFWALTGRAPFASEGTARQILLRRFTQPPPQVRRWRPDISSDLEAFILRLMALDPAERFSTAQAVMTALLPFLKTESLDYRPLPCQVADAVSRPLPPSAESTEQASRVLVVDDNAMIRTLCSHTLAKNDIACDTANNAAEALLAVITTPYALVLTDWQMPGMTGLELCRKLRLTPPTPNLKVIIFSSSVSDDEVAQVLAAGADDYLQKQFTPVQLVARIRAALHLKASQDRADLLNRHLLASNALLERSLAAKDGDLFEIRNALVLGLADLVSQRDTENVTHAMRLPRYCRCLAEEAARLPCFADQIDANFIALLECCAPLHDIGKVAVPDHILGKAGNLDAEERLIMQTHTVIGAETLQKVARRHGTAVGFLQMAIDIARHHHERFDGKGYPDHLEGNTIPLAARIVALGDVYDALRCRRPYKPALSHAATVQMMEEAFVGQFDPHLFQAYQRCASQFEAIFRDMPA